MIQDIEPYHLSNDFTPISPNENSYFLCYKDNQILLKKTDKGIIFPNYSDFSKEKLEEYTYLFSMEKSTFYLSEIPESNFSKDFHLENMQTLRKTTPKHLTYAGLVGYQLYNWYQNRRFCGHCGTTMKMSKKERMLFCPECNNMEYPKISPAVIIAVTDGNKILMSKYAGREFKNYALLAGFAEVGETIEDTVRREVFEEVGIKVKNLRYYKSQPWPFSNSLLLGFFAELDGDPTIKLDEEELAMAQWFKREEMPVTSDDFSLTNEMMMQFKNNTI